jgi:Kef-type K+ transport system membrane component KefB
MSGASITPILQVALFLFLVWFIGRLCRFVNVAPILGEIAVGVVMKSLHLIPKYIYMFYQEDHDDQNHLSKADWRGNVTGYCDTDEGPKLAGLITGKLQCINVLSLLGNIGVTLMIFESGMHIHFSKIKKVAKKALVVAILGTALPMLIGMGFVALLFSKGTNFCSSSTTMVCDDDDIAIGSDCPGAAEECDHFPSSGFAAGIALAPTSVGIALKMLGEVKQLGSMFGQLIVTAAFIDDIFSLILLVIMQAVAAGHLTVGAILVPLFSAFGFVIIGALLAVKVWKRLFPFLLRRVPRSDTASLDRPDEVHLLIMPVNTKCAFLSFSLDYGYCILADDPAPILRFPG